jgi:hypothetical protein
MDYKHKYLKYKRKYLALKQKGGSNKITVISIENTENKKKFFSYKLNDKYVIINDENNKKEYNSYLVLLELIEKTINNNASKIKMQVFEVDINLLNNLHDIGTPIKILFEVDKYVPVILYTLKIGKLVKENRDLITGYMKKIM